MFPGRGHSQSHWATCSSVSPPSVLLTNQKQFWDNFEAEINSHIPWWYLSPPTALRFTTWTGSTWGPQSFCQEKQAVMEVYGGVFGFIHHFQESVQKKIIKIFILFTALAIHLVLMLPSSGCRSYWRDVPGSTGSYHSQLLTCSALSPWEQLCVMLHPQARACEQWGEQRHEGKAAWKS